MGVGWRQQSNSRFTVKCFPSLLGRSHSPRWGRAQNTSILAQGCQDARGILLVSLVSLPLIHTAQAGDRQTDRCAHGEKVSKSGDSSAHLSQCKHIPALAIQCKYYLAKDYWVLLSSRE